MATDAPLEPAGTIEHKTSRTGRWLRARRIRFALWIAVIEGNLFWGRTARSDTARQLSWIAGASQALAVVVVILAFILSWLALLLAGIFALVAVLFLLSDRG